MTDEQLFDADFLRRLRTLFFKLRKRRQLQKKGAEQTTALGFTREFKDYRSYTSSDDFRSIDWRLYARMDRLYVKLFEEIQEFHVHIVLDRSASMVEPHPEKRVMSLRLAVALAYLALMNQHRVSIRTFGDTLDTATPPLKGQGHIHKVLDHLAGLPFQGETDLSSLRSFRPGRGRKGIVFVLSDLLSLNPSEARESLRSALHWPAETHVVQFLHPRELRPRLEGELQLVDVETGEMRRIHLNKRDMERYTNAFDAFVEDLRQFCMKKQVAYSLWNTDAPFEGAFLDLLSKGSALAHS